MAANAARSPLVALVLATSMLSPCSLAPGQEGAWQSGFNHDVTGSNATNFEAPFVNNPGFDRGGSQQGMGTPGLVFGWSAFEAIGSFNAIHMCLIPKGPRQGKVLVWNRYAVVLRPGAPFDATNYWVFQGWSILDPAPDAPQPRFRNFLLPLLHVGPTQPSITATQRSADLFCSGHTWTQHGDLVVGGGARCRACGQQRRSQPHECRDPPRRLHADVRRQ